MAGRCVKGCYAKQRSYCWPQTIRAYERRLKLSQSPRFVDTLDKEIKRRHPKHIRIHDSGDFYSPAYLDKWMEIVRRNPDVIFYAYTKCVSYFKGKPLPDNFTVIFSEGGSEDHLIDRALDRFAKVFPSVKAVRLAGFADAHLNDLKALGPNRRIGVVYHGYESRRFQT